MSREAKIAAAATFLSDPATASAPLGAKMQYLRKQHGLTQAEVEQAIARVSAPPSSAAAAAGRPEPDVAAFYAASGGAEEQAFVSYYRHPAGAGAPESKLIREGMSANRSFVQDRLRAMPVSAERKKAAEAHREAGVLSYQKGSYDKALTDFRAAISKNPTLTQLLSYTSNCLAKLGQHAAAAEDAASCVASNPAFVGGYKQLATAQRAMGKAEEAIATLTKGIQACPKAKVGPLQAMLVPK